ncbi:small toxic inner membrane protein TimP [Salmonella enterica subsp. enterica serovar Winslow]
MKRYICIVLIVSGALLSAGKGGWNISGNSIRVTVNVSGK